MKKAQWTDLFREIKRSRGRYLSLLFIVALGTAFYAGVRSSEPDMTSSVDQYYDETDFLKAYEIVKQQQWKVDSYSDGHIEGTIEVLEDGIMFTSIPYDDGWTILVDGKEVEAIPLLENAFLGAKLKKGNHEVKMNYEAPGKMFGGIVSCVTWTGILIMYILGKLGIREDK